MGMRHLGIAALVLSLLAAVPAAAQESLERVVVRNRLHNLDKRLEVSPTVSVMLLSHLTDHVLVGGSAAMNFTETWALDGRASFGFTRQTGLAREVAERFLARDPRQGLQIAEDMADLWEMKGNAVIGLRWTPIYGKISLVSELPVHFQAFLSAGGGMGMFHRRSLVYCRQATRDESGASCGDWLTEDRAGWVASGAFGMRFFTHQNGAVKVELRDYMFPDRYRVRIDRLVAETGGATGEQAKAGFTHLVMLELGYTFIF